MAENKNLYQRISAVMQDVEYLKKDDSVGSGSYAYKAISEEKVTETVRTSLIKNGLVILPVEQDHKLTDHARPDRNGQATIIPISTVDTKYKIVNIDNPSEFEIICSSGTGVDPQDKGVGKAMTYSYKYLLLRTFAIPTGEDPDKVHNNDLGKQQLSIKDKKSIGEKAMQEAVENTSLATDEQKEQFKELLMHDAITHDVRVARMKQLNSYTQTEIAKKIAGIKGVIREYERAQEQAA